MKKFFQKIDVVDVFVLGGIGLIGYGCWLVYKPSAFIVVGLALLLLGFLASKPPPQ